jgi:predicted ATPase
LPLLRGGFATAFEKPITIIIGENGTGKFAVLEGIAALAGYDEAGGGKGCRPVDHVSQAASAHREFRQYPSCHGNAFALADGLSDRATLEAFPSWI